MKIEEVTNPLVGSYKTRECIGSIHDGSGQHHDRFQQDVHFHPYPRLAARDYEIKVLRNIRRVLRNTLLLLYSQNEKGGAVAPPDDTASANRTAASGWFYTAVSNKAAASAGHAVAGPLSEVSG